jgi:transposase InsO family protein
LNFESLSLLQKQGMVQGLPTFKKENTRYFLLFIDDCSRTTWVYFLKEKSQTFENFKVFQRLVENETKENIGTLQTNNGGEFTSKEFQTFYSEKGIRKKFTNAYTPQNNGVTERMNFTLLGMTRSMLTLKNLSPSY